jgi:tRNA threonylcarbamoyl adenosine modification protein YjeE
MTETPQPPFAARLELAQIEIEVADLAGTEHLAAALARVARRGDVLALDGPLGAGKTAFARAFIRALMGPAEEVPSPTFTLVQSYDAPGFTIWHVDLYRLEDAGELDELGLDEAFASGVTLIEWPARAEAWRGAGWLTIRFALIPGAPARRHLTLEAGAGWRARLADLTPQFVA